jgi:hypothetical protein
MNTLPTMILIKLEFFLIKKEGACVLIGTIGAQD